MSFPPPDPVRDAATASSPATAPAHAPDEVPPGTRVGDLTASWRGFLAAGWVAAFFAYAGVWQASVQIGIGTWWIGPRAQPTNIVVRLLPFFLVLTVCLLLAYNVRWILRWSGLGVAAALLISIPDFSRSVGLGIAEATIAGLLALLTLAATTGRYRAAPSDPASR